MGCGSGRPNEKMPLIPTRRRFPTWRHKMMSNTSTMVPPMRLPTTGLPAWLCFGSVVVVAAPAANELTTEPASNSIDVTLRPTPKRGRNLDKQVASDVGDLDLVGSGVDLENLCVTSELLHAVLSNVAIATEQLHGFHGHF